MKKLLLSGSLLALLLPSFAFAAYNDVSLTTDAVIQVGSISLNVTGSTAVVESITVTSTNFSFTLQANSSLKVIDSSQHTLAVSSDTHLTTDTCDSGSTLGFTISSGSETVTVTPSTNTYCVAGKQATVASGSGGAVAVGGGGGGGGGGGSNTVTTTTTTTATTSTTTTTPTTTQTTANPTTQTGGQHSALIASLTAQLNALLAQIAQLQGAASFTRNLETGSTGADVMALQVWLNGHGYTLASSGPGSPGNETSRFGALTRVALIKLQKAVGITPAAGYFGPVTRAYVAAHS